MDDDTSRLNFGCLDPQVRRIIDCLQRLNRLTDGVIKCLDNCSDSTKRDILFCLLLDALEDRTLSCATDSVLTCGQGIDGVTRAIRTDVNNVLATLPSASTQSQIGRLFAANGALLLSSLTPGGSIIISNPLTSGRIMYIDSILGGSNISPLFTQNLSSAQPIEIIMRRDSAAGTTEASVRNLNYGFPDNSVMNGTLSTALGNGDVVAYATQTFGSLISLDFSGKIIVPPGHSFSIDALLTGVLEPDTALVQVLLTVIWYELDIPV